jgi:hypothetical protein
MMKGGYRDVASFPAGGIPSWSYYPYNTTLGSGGGDPSNSTLQQSSRLLPDFPHSTTTVKGGKRKQKSVKRRQRGGIGIGFAELTNAYPLVGTSQGTSVMTNAYSGNNHGFNSQLPSYYDSRHPALA